MLAVLLPGSAAATTVGANLLVSIVGQPGTYDAFGGPDAATNTPLDLAVDPGDVLEIYLRIDVGLPMHLYNTTITATDPSQVDFVNGSAVDLTGLGFSLVADPNTTLTDGTPSTGSGGSNLGATALSSNTLYRLRYQVSPTFLADGTRDITLAIDSIVFGNLNDSLDPNLDTASIRLQQAAAVPEPGSLALLGTGLAALARHARRRHADRPN
jgi:hypothetical protein